MSGNTGYVMTLANSIIGVSLLAMPYCFKQCGIILSIFMLIASNIVTRISCYFLIKSGSMARRKSCEFIAYHAFGASGKLLVEFGVVGFMMGSCVASFVVIGDLAPSISSQILDIPNTPSLRSLLLLGVTILMILPLALLRNTESLAAVSTVSVLFYALLAVNIFSESITALFTPGWTNSVVFWRTEGILQCFPIFSTALACQTQIFEILAMLPNATTDKMNYIIKSALNMCTGLYIVVGFLGYMAYAKTPFGGNILLSFAPSLSSEMFQVGFVLSVVVTFPCLIFPCRASLHSMLFKKGAQYHELTSQTTHIPDSQFKCLTFTIVAIGLTVGLLIPTIEIVLGFVGSTIGLATCIVFPASAFIRISNKETSERLLAKILLAIGAVAIILGTYGNMRIYTAVIDTPRPSPTKPTVLIIEKPSMEFIKLPVVEEIVPASVPADVKEFQKDTKKVEVLKEQEKPPPQIPPEVQKVKVDPLAEKQKQLLPEQLPNLVKLTEKPNFSEVIDKNIETVHKDAIEKEIKERKLDDSQQKLEETKKHEELLKKLEGHKAEQKKLLEEQKNILNEIKNRTKTEKPVEPIKSKVFDEKIEKIQEVIDDLKERKQIIDKAISDKIAIEKQQAVNKKEKTVEDIKVRVVTNVSQNVDKVAEPERGAEKAAARDLLQERKKREKRDVSGNCEKSDKETNLIKESKVISLPDSFDLPEKSLIGNDVANKQLIDLKLEKTKKRK